MIRAGSGAAARFLPPLLMLALGACTAVLRPVAKLPDAAEMPRLGLAGPVHVAAGDVDARPHRFAASPYTVVVDYADFTDVAVRLLREELGRQGAVVGEGGRKLRVAVAYVSLMRSPGALACVVDYRVVLGDGRELGIQSRSSSWSFTSACDAAVAAGTAAILRDATVAAYLGG